MSSPVLDPPRQRPPPSPAAPAILEAGRNCWRTATVHRLAWLIDGEQYFSAFRDAVLRANHSIFILAWDIDSRTVLAPEASGDGWPATLGAFLNSVVSRRRGLRAYVLDWDYPMFYQSDREIAPTYVLGERTHRRVKFRMDAEHPLGGSHHQKIVVIDDAVAFVGGLDLTNSRWDAPAHAPDDPRRETPSGQPYPPFHDVQAMVDGEAAVALGELARARWLRATGEKVRSLKGPRSDPWPESVQPALTDAEVAIARTQPQYGEGPAVQEIKRLYLDAIASARRHIYIENQYFTAPAIGDALARRLGERDGPEIVLVSRLRGGGWLEESTMGALRVRMLRALRAADRYGRLRAYYPDHAGLGDHCINLHSKLMVVDDRFAQVGSANLNNRSLGYDTECDLALEADEARVEHAVALLRNRLLAEHLGVSTEQIAGALTGHGSLIGTIEALRGNTRTLTPLDPDAAPQEDTFILDPSIVDPERPVDPDRLAAQFVPRRSRPVAAQRLAAAVVVLLIAAGLAAAWRWTPLRDLLNVGSLASDLEILSHAPFAPLLVLGAYLLASLIAFPITLLILVTGLVFGPVGALLYAWAGSLLGAAAGFGLGRVLARDLVQRLAGRHLTAIGRRLGRQGLLAVIAVRIVPIAPFTVVNLAAGAAQVRLRDFMLGTFLGMSPGIVAVTVFWGQVLAALRQPSLWSLMVLGLVAAAIVFGAAVLRRWLTRRTMTGAQASRASAAK
jgi:phospholipase D1/2